MNMNGLVTLTAICKEYSVSRKTYYKWKNRYTNNGMEGLYDLSRVPYAIKYRVDKSNRRNYPGFTIEEI
jgi:transposase-like protein